MGNSRGCRRARMWRVFDSSGEEVSLVPDKARKRLCLVGSRTGCVSHALCKGESSGEPVCSGASEGSSGSACAL